MRTRKDGTIPHGYGGYINYKCRCDVCRSGWATYHRERQRTYVPVTHNKAGYGNGCRCDVCRLAHTESRREYRRKKREAA